MKLEIDFSNTTPEQADVAIAMLQAFRSSFAASSSAAIVQPTVTHNGGSSEPEAAPSSGDPAGESAVSGKASQPETAETTDKPKRGRKPKADPAVETKEYADGTKATGPAPLPEQSPTEQKAAPADISIDALRAALQRFTATNGMPAGIDLLGEFGCKRISELVEKPEADRVAFLAKCPAAEAA